jgi:hypothetical protein
MAINTAINSGANGSLAPTDDVTFNKVTVTTNIDMPAGAHSFAASIGANDLTIGGATSTVLLPGNLTVNGTTTTIKTQDLIVKDKNIIINHGGSTAGTTSAGIDIEGDAAVIVGYLRVGSSDNSLFEFKAPGNSSVLTLDINATETITVGGSLNIEADSVINQDLSTDAAPTFSDLTLTTLNVNNGIVTTNAAGNLSTGTALPNGTTATTQSANDNSTNLATTAYADAAVSAAFVWNEILGTTQAMSPDNGYVANNAARVSFSLPATAAFGQIIKVVGKGAGGWRITQGVGQVIHYGIIDTSSGATGYLESTHRYDAVELVCTTANLEWTVIPQGKLNTDI